MGNGGYLCDIISLVNFSCEKVPSYVGTLMICAKLVNGITSLFHVIYMPYILYMCIFYRVVTFNVVSTSFSAINVPSYTRVTFLILNRQHSK